VPDARSKARLTVARDDARTQLKERIEKAKEIRADAIRSHMDFEQAKERERRWHEYNRRLLSNLFTTNEFANGYASVRSPLHVFHDRYIDPTFYELKRRLIRRINSQISTLVSIIERLDNILDVKS
jgi:hypothetical protein